MTFLAYLQQFESWEDEDTEEVYSLASAYWLAEDMYLDKEKENGTASTE